MIHDHDFSCEFQSFVHVMGDKNHGFTEFFLQVLNQFLQSFTSDGVQGAIWFVHQNQILIGC